MPPCCLTYGYSADQITCRRDARALLQHPCPSSTNHEQANPIGVVHPIGCRRSLSAWCRRMISTRVSRSIEPRDGSRVLRAGGVLLAHTQISRSSPLGSPYMSSRWARPTRVTHRQIPCPAAYGRSNGPRLRAHCRGRAAHRLRAVSVTRFARGAGMCHRPRGKGDVTHA